MSIIANSSWRCDVIAKDERLLLRSMFGKVIYILHSATCVSKRFWPIDEQKIVRLIAANFREERIIVRKIAATFREEGIIARKFAVNYRGQRIIVRKFARIGATIGVTKMRGNFVEISF